MEQIEKKKIGFAAISPERLKEIARKGGIAAHAQGKGYTWTPEAAKVAGRRGGQASRAKKAQIQADQKEQS